MRRMRATRANVTVTAAMRTGKRCPMLAVAIGIAPERTGKAFPFKLKKIPVPIDFSKQPSVEKPKDKPWHKLPVEAVVKFLGVNYPPACRRKKSADVKRNSAQIA